MASRCRAYLSPIRRIASKSAPTETTAYACLLQNDVNLTSPSPLATSCTDTTGATPFVSAFPDKPFEIDNVIAATDKTCPAPGSPLRTAC